MSQIFVSYSRRDLEIVDSIVEEIEAAGIGVWIDREDIKAGKTWRVQIVEAIATCDAFVLMLSSNSAASDNVRREIDLAQDAGCAVFILKLDPVKLPAEMLYQLVGLQHIELQQLGIDEAVHRLIDTLEEHLATWKQHDDRTVRQVELVFQEGTRAEFGANKRAETLGLIAAVTETPQSQLEIANLEAGGVHVFVDMPATAAFELKTRALNRDGRLKRFGVKSLRVVGDKQYVNISLGILTATATIGTLNMLWGSLPSLFPSLFGVAVGKVVVITTFVVVTTAASIALADGIGPNLSPAQTTAFVTNPPVHHSPLPPSGGAMAIPTSTPAESPAPASISGPTIPPTSSPLPSQTIAPTPSPTQSSVVIPSTRAPSPTPTPTTNSIGPLVSTDKVAQIVSVECGSGLALNIHIRISNDAGISSYSIWSTWGGGGQIDQTFTAPLPKVIDEVVVHEPVFPDTVDRQHQVGLKVTTPDHAQPIYTYAMEPDGRCPGHYQSPTTVTVTPTDTPTATQTPTASQTTIPTDRPTATQTPTASQTPIPSDTPTPTASQTPIPTDTPTATQTATATILPPGNEPTWTGAWTHINPHPGGVGSGQTFIPSDSNLMTVDVSILTGNPGSGDDTITLKILSADQQVLGTSSQFVVDGFDGWLHFQFPDAGLMVTPGDTYIIALEDTGKTTFGWMYADDTYPNGHAMMLGADKPSYDFFFRINR